jgi:hypothetical protein
VGCVDFHFNAAQSNKNTHPEFDQDDVMWTIIATKNKYDMSWNSGGGNKAPYGVTV